MRENKLKKIMSEGRVAAGMALYTGDPVIVEILGHCGFDFVFIDTEHSPLGVDQKLEHLIRAADSSGISTVVRVKCNDESMIRNAFEAGADAIVIPHVRTAQDARSAVKFSKFPPLGSRGAAAEVRSANYGAGDFNWLKYIDDSNANTMIIPLAEDKEFFDNMDEILDVEGVAAVNFGPTDLSMSMGIPMLYQLDNPVIQDCFNKLTAAAKVRNIPLMCPVAPPTLEKAQQLVGQGVRMLILRNDIVNFRGACQSLISNIVEPLKNGK